MFTRLDYCNSFRILFRLIFSLCHKYSLQRLQRIQNCLARLVKHLPRSSPTSSVIKELGWLRVDDRVIFKLLILTHKCIYGSSPQYLKHLLFPVFSRNVPFALRSHNGVRLFCPISRSASVCKSFSFLAPRLWNSLPVHIRKERCLKTFSSQLKVHLL